MKASGIKMILTVTLICITSATLLSYVYSVTKLSTKESKLTEKIEAIRLVIKKKFFNKPEKEEKIIEYKNIKVPVYEAKDKGGNLVGRAMLLETDNGYSGKIVLMLGVDNQGRITGIKVLEHLETPGLGSKIEEETFLKQFYGKSIDDKDFIFKVAQDKGSIAAITSATISSRAVTDVIGEGLTALKEWLKKSKIK